jgi:hypothetical protein
MANVRAQKTARSKIDFIAHNWRSILFIHHSSGVTGNEAEGYSPRITSIAVTHAESGATQSFGMHLVAERRGIPRELVHLHYESLELDMLEEFNAFVAEHPSDYWVHWSMRDINFGFEAIAHRFRVVSGRSAPTIEEDRRFCLRSLLTDTFGPEFAPQPRLRGLMVLNGGLHESVLSATEESSAFENRQFIKMHQSTMAKAWFLRCALSTLIEGKLKTAVSRPGYWVSALMERPFVKIIGLLAVLITLWEGGSALVHWMSRNQDEFITAPAAIKSGVTK